MGGTCQSESLGGLCMFPPQGHWLLTSVAQHLPLTWLVHLFSFSSLWAYKSLFMPQPLLPTSVCNFLTTCCGWGGSVLFMTLQNARLGWLEVPTSLLFRNTATLSRDGLRGCKVWATSGIRTPSRSKEVCQAPSHLIITKYLHEWY